MSIDMKSIVQVLPALWMAIAGCSSSSGSGTNPADASTSGSGSDGGSGATSGERTLSSCAANVDPAVPAFYKNYFACSDISVSGSNIVITTEGLPPHRSYYYGAGSPNYADFDTTRGSDYHANPNTLAAKKVTFTIPVDPTPRGVTVTEALMTADGTNGIQYPLGPAGVAIDSVLLFNPVAAPGDDIEDEKYTFDSYNAHPTGTQIYHYHTNSPGPLEVLMSRSLVTTTTLGSAEIELFGMMCDGTVVLGCTELDGSQPSADLDAQNGHIHDLADKSGAVLLASRYHTHVCPEKNLGTFHYTPKIEYYSSCNQN